jgi:hypothetical protein
MNSILTFQILALNLDFISAFSATSAVKKAVKIFEEE